MSLLVLSAVGLQLMAPPSAAMPEAPTAGLALPTMKAGAPIRFSVKSRNQSGDRSHPDDSGSELTFDVQVLNATSHGASVRFTLQAGTGWGDEYRGIPSAWLASFKDVPVDIDVDPSGLPLQIANWKDIRRRVLVAAPPGGPAGIPLSPRDTENLMRGYFLRYGPAKDLLAMSAMQLRDRLALGRTELPGAADEVVRVSRSIDVADIDSARCRVELRRTTIQTVTIADKVEPPTSLETTADVSTADGWVISLHETRPDPDYIDSLDIVRLTPAQCP